jgi:hypothetical protein
MLYYPKSQIKPNLYTNGNEYVFSTTKEEYKGYYYEVSNGQKYTGKNPQDGSNILLSLLDPLTLQIENLTKQNLTYIEVQDNISEGVYTFISPLRVIPQFNPTLPTTQDQQNGQFTRYFCKRNNDTQYLEISKETHDQLKSRNPQIAWDLFTPVSLIWQIVGNKEQVYNSNRASTIAIEQNLKWYGFSQYFQDKFLKYYVES